VATLPHGRAAPLVIAQHLDPNYPTHLGEIPARRSQGAVHTVVDHELLAPVELTPLVRRTVTVARVLAAGQQLKLDAADEPVVVTADDGRVEQVVLNLLTNAITYAPNSARTDVRVRQSHGVTEIEVMYSSPPTLVGTRSLQHRGGCSPCTSGRPIASAACGGACPSGREKGNP
jgi:hypothetical protein